MGVAAVLPIVGPIIFLSLPTQIERHPRKRTGGGGSGSGNLCRAGTAGCRLRKFPLRTVRRGCRQRSKPAGQVFQRGQFTFNRRFFETKFSGYFGVVRHGAEKDQTLLVKTGGGQFVVERITRISSPTTCISRSCRAACIRRSCCRSPRFRKSSFNPKRHEIPQHSFVWRARCRQGHAGKNPWRHSPVSFIAVAATCSATFGPNHRWGKLFLDYSSRGQLVPDEPTIELWQQFIERPHPVRAAASRTRHAGARRHPAQCSPGGDAPTTCCKSSAFFICAARILRASSRGSNAAP